MHYTEMTHCMGENILSCTYNYVYTTEKKDSNVAQYIPVQDYNEEQKSLKKRKTWEGKAREVRRKSEKGDVLWIAEASVPKRGCSQLGCLAAIDKVINLHGATMEEVVLTSPLWGNTTQKT